MGKTISILGCGWLGTALGKSLLRKGWKVKGSTSSTPSYNRLEMTGISAFYVRVGTEEVEIDYNSFFSTDTLVVSLPPERTELVVEDYPQRIKQVAHKVEEMGVEKVLFISSTSVYALQNKEVREGDEGNPDKLSGKALLEAEKILLNKTNFKTTVLRFGGLIGYDRNPAKFIRNKKSAHGEAPVNLIHRDDCVGIITSMLEKEIWGEVFNASCPEHPTKKQFYTKAAQLCDLEPPVFSEEGEGFKIVNSKKLIKALDYRFLYPGPMDYLKEIEEWAYRI